ncbi:hypothetical protein EVG20_g6531 [Dentipellis fragilis]|uniref:Formamidase n=1 Tax=Dentipellis fragilis TaxID=205917 RepID=A0A4Y9YKJ0_9AGAM|nr:hypothetical protein EVG20_g6531 [Dentipellis fragilis]
MATKANSVPHPTLVKVDPFVPADQQKGIHNRWHPDIPPVATVKQGEVFKIECVDWTGAQIGNNDTSDDIRDVDLTKVHNLSGPIAVEGAEPGDCLVVDILDDALGLHRHLRAREWWRPFREGIQQPRRKGNLGLQRSVSPLPHSAHPTHPHPLSHQASTRPRDTSPASASPASRTPASSAPRPPAELLATWNERETGLIAQHADAVPPVAFAPEPKGAYVGQDLDEEVRAKIAREGARTVPGREHGGNCDIKNLSRGSRCYFPVFVKGANLSVGDLHFSQGDGELSFCGAIEMAGIITFSTSVIKGGIEKFALKQPVFLPSPIDPLYSSKLIFEGISVDYHGDGKQYNMDATVAYKQAARNAIAYLEKLGFTREQAYLLLSAAPVESHVGAVVVSHFFLSSIAFAVGHLTLRTQDSPNACVTLALPLGIFDFDILPREEGLTKHNLGQCAIRSDGVL